MFNWWLFIAFVGSACFAPGPNNITSIAMARGYGITQSIKYAAGALIGFAALNFLCCAFNGLIARILPSAQSVLAVLGALYFLYLAYSILRSKTLEDGGAAKKAGFFAGILIQFINPQGIFFALSIAAVHVTPHFHTLGAYALFSVLMGVVAFVMIAVWGVFGLVIARFFKKYNLAVNIVLSLLLVYCAYSVFMGMFR